MLIAGIVALCVVLLVLAFLAPRLSRHPERGAHKALGLGGRAGGMAPGKLGTWLSKPFHKGSRAAGRSASAGRRGRGKLPL
ncbi:MAG: hypothetical protein H0T43_05865 [Solirubrobacterales bacterium]|nr:hypothetical protein [Solirubrobacterales bacterium]